MLLGCTHTPKYKVNDCIDMMAMIVDNEGKWHAQAKSLGEFQVIKIVKSTKQNKYMAEHLHSDYLYVLKDIDVNPNMRIRDDLIIPVQSLDSYLYTTVVWELPENNVWNCNTYEWMKK